jgi:hypothetical protein
LVATEILKHFVFVIPPNDDIPLMDEKKDPEGDSDIFLNTIITKVKDLQLVFTGHGRKATPTGTQSESGTRLVSLVLLPKEPSRTSQ